MNQRGHPTASGILPFSITSSNRDYTSGNGNDSESFDHLLKLEHSETFSNNQFSHSSSSTHHNTYRKAKASSLGCKLCLYWKTSFIFLYKQFNGLYTRIRILSQTNIYFVVFATFFLSICFGIVFYSNWHDWQISTSFYYSSQVLLGNMYGIPVELDGFSQVFTLVFFLWGTALIATFHLVATSNEFLHLQRLSSLLPVPTATTSTSQLITPNSDSSSSGGIGFHRFLQRIWRRFLEFIRSNFQSSYLTATCSVIWVILGTLFGVLYEKWTVAESLYFAVGAMSAAGIPVPSCLNGDDEFPLATCQLGPFRGCALGVYLIVGVPLFAFTIGHVAGYLVFSVTNYSRRKIFLRRQQMVREGKSKLNYQLLLSLSGDGDSVDHVISDRFDDRFENNVLTSSPVLGSARSISDKDTIQVTTAGKSIKISPPKESIVVAVDKTSSSPSLSHKPDNDEQQDETSRVLIHSNTNSANNSTQNSHYKRRCNRNNSSRDDGTFAYESFEKFQFLLESSDDINAYFLRELLVTRKIALADVQQIYISLCQSAALSLAAEVQSSTSSSSKIASV